MRLRVCIVHAFTAANALAGTSGNPAAVVLLQGEALAGMSDACRQRVAAALNLSETAYVQPLPDAAGCGDAAGGDVFAAHASFGLRWFTPTVEVPLCGHATLASAAVLLAEAGNRASRLTFHTASGELSVSQVELDGRQLLQMSLPACPATDELPPALAPAATGARSVCGSDDVYSLLRNAPGLRTLLRACLAGLPGLPGHDSASGDGDTDGNDARQLASLVSAVGFAAPLRYLHIALSPAAGCGLQALRALSPCPTKLSAAAPAEQLTGVVISAAVTAAPGSGSSNASGSGSSGGCQYQVASRFFAPWAGIPEDPVTGSAHAVIAPYWAQVLGRVSLRAHQCSPRGGDVWCDVGVEPGRVLVSGVAAVVESWERDFS